ncbi:hypothetical protein [Microbacterium sp.]|jgi:hypothetical protein|nr:hypothetical protein [Microbacterium sp.]
MTPATPPADLLDRYFAPAVEATLEGLRAGDGAPTPPDGSSSR